MGLRSYDLSQLLHLATTTKNTFENIKNSGLKSMHTVAWLSDALLHLTPL